MKKKDIALVKARKRKIRSKKKVCLVHRVPESSVDELGAGARGRVGAGAGFLRGFQVPRRRRSSALRCLGMFSSLFARGLSDI